MSAYARITFFPSRVTGAVPRGTSLLHAARLLGVGMEGPCGGSGKCAKDLVQVRTGKTLDTVLACKTIVETDLEVIVPSHEKKEIKVVGSFYQDSEKKAELDPAVWKKAVSKNGHGPSTNVYINGKLMAEEHGDTTGALYGVAVDIGTTTIAASLVDIKTGRSLGDSSILNPLVHYGHDVMSRIRFSALHEDGLGTMHRELRSAVNLLIGVVCLENEVDRRSVYQLVAAGNTTMQHIFLNKGIKSIGEFPYNAEVLDEYTASAAELGVDIAPFGLVTTLPCISAYVGGDIVSGLVAVADGETALPAIFLDIGTNGELALLLEDRIIATSTAAGPCFEGMTISSGMRAAEGAVEHVRLAPELVLDVIGGGVPRGICGSGLLDLVSELLRTGLVNSRGRLQGAESAGVPQEYKKYLFEKEEKRHFRVYDEVSISQEDIRQVQLAKAAFRAGIEILLKEYGIAAADLKKVIIGGGFGYHLDEESIIRTGMLPGGLTTGISFVGNSSLEGAVRTLLDRKLIGRARGITGSSHAIDLSQIPAFESAYVREMHF